MNKKRMLEIIKDSAKSYYTEDLHLSYKGEKKACLRVPKKRDTQTWKEYFEKIEIEPVYRNKPKNNEYILSIKLDYFDSFINILIDDINYS